MNAWLNEHTRVRCMREVWTDAIALYFMRRDPDGHVSYATDLVMSEPYNPLEVDIQTVPVPPLRLDLDVAQRLMDELWDCGLRPSEGTGSAGAMRQAEAHIATLKKENDLAHDLLRQLVTKVTSVSNEPKDIVVQPYKVVK